MPSFDLVFSWHAGNTYREQAITSTYDLKDVKLEKHIKGNIPIEGLNWQIGCIVGSSGSGKTSIARHCWPEAYYADLKERYKEPCFLNDFPTELTISELGAGVRCYVAKLGDKPIAFIAVAHVHMLVNYFRVSRLVVLPDYQGIGVGKRLLNFVAELYTSQLPEIPFYLVTSNPQLIRSNLDGWRVKRVGHGSSGRNDSRINRELVKSNSKRRLSVSLQYIPKHKTSEA